MYFSQLENIFHKEAHRTLNKTIVGGKSHHCYLCAWNDAQNTVSDVK